MNQGKTTAPFLHNQLPSSYFAVSVLGSGLNTFASFRLVLCAAQGLIDGVLCGIPQPAVRPAPIVLINVGRKVVVSLSKIVPRGNGGGIESSF